MEIKQIDLNTMEEIYNKFAVKDFPKSELKPFKHIQKLYEEGKYIGYGFYEDDELLAYAFMTDVPDESISLLDYFAVSLEKRGLGIGSQCLELLKTIGKDIIIVESEDPEFAKTPDELNTRVKRIKFYKNNGLYQSGITTKVYGVEYCIFALASSSCNEKIDDNKTLEITKKLYHSMFSPLQMTNVHLY